MSWKIKNGCLFIQDKRAINAETQKLYPKIKSIKENKSIYMVRFRQNESRLSKSFRVVLMTGPMTDSNNVGQVMYLDAFELCFNCFPPYNYLLMF